MSSEKRPLNHMERLALLDAQKEKAASTKDSTLVPETSTPALTVVPSSTPLSTTVPEQVPQQEPTEVPAVVPQEVPAFVSTQETAKKKTNFRKGKARFTPWIDEAKYNAISIYAALNGLSLGRMTEEAFDNYWGQIIPDYPGGTLMGANRGTTQGTKISTGVPLDHDYEKIDIVIDELMKMSPREVYEKLSNNQLTPADLRHFREIEREPALLIKTVIAYSVLHSKEPVGSFKYCLAAMKTHRGKVIDFGYFANQIYKLFEKGKLRLGQ
jgi:hypothetical protein